MKIIIYFVEYIVVKILFFIFKIIGYKNSSNLGFLIGKYFGPLFRSKSLIKNKIVSQVQLSIPTYTKENLPKELIGIDAIKPGSRNL